MSPVDEQGRYVAPPSTVYVFYDGEGQALYVGVTRGAGSRLAQHTYRSGWWPEVASANFEHIEDGRAACDRERWLIEHLDPRYNVRHKLPTAPATAAPEPAEAA